MSQTATKNSQVYVGGLPVDIRASELRTIFQEYGEIREISIKRKYAFVEFADYHAARDATNGMDQRRIFDHHDRITVEPTLKNSGANRRRDRDGRDSRRDDRGERRGRGPSPNDKCYKCNAIGHWARDCPDRRRRSRSRDKNFRDRDRKEGRCFVCKDIGHKARDCPRREGGRSRSRSRSRASYSRSRERYDDRGGDRRSGERGRKPRGKFGGMARDRGRYRSYSYDRVSDYSRNREGGGGRGGRDRGDVPNANGGDFRRSGSNQSRQFSDDSRGGAGGRDRKVSRSPYQRGRGDRSKSGGEYNADNDYQNGGGNRGFEERKGSDQGSEPRERNYGGGGDRSNRSVSRSRQSRSRHSSYRDRDDSRARSNSYRRDDDQQDRADSRKDDKEPKENGVMEGDHDDPKKDHDEPANVNPKDDLEQNPEKDIDKE